MVLTNFAHDSLLDLDPWVGQRSATFRFRRFNSVTGIYQDDITPLRGATLTHDTTKTIKRQLNLSLGVEDTAAINTIQDRIDVFMVFPNGSSYPLGRYMFTDSSRQKYVNGKLSNVVLSDEMFKIDQPITAGITGNSRTAESLIKFALAGQNVEYRLATSGFQVTTNWGIGSNLGSILESVATVGDYFSPWYGNDTLLHFIRSFDPATQICDFDFDNSNKVVQGTIIESDNLLTAPNRFIVISNAANDSTQAAFGSYDIPNNAPHSVRNRGFVIADVRTLQVPDSKTCAIVAKNIGIQNTVFEVVNLTTAPDPRHDSYNVIRWQGANWLELGWSMALVEGGTMSHRLRKSYS